MSDRNDNEDILHAKKDALMQVLKLDLTDIPELAGIARTMYEHVDAMLAIYDMGYAQGRSAEQDVVCWFPVSSSAQHAWSGGFSAAFDDRVDELPRPGITWRIR